MMFSAATSAAGPGELPGLDHLRHKVEHWDAAVRTLSFTAAAIADSVGAASAAVHPSFGDSHGFPGSASTSHATMRESMMQPPSSPKRPPSADLPSPTAVITVSQLKPGRVFIVANLQGAYYTLVELLSRHKFDFRQDNLLHLGNLVAPPPPSIATPQPTAGTFHPGTQPAGSAVNAPAVGLARRCRNSAPLLKLIRRHCGGNGGGGGGPMGANECLALLAAARANRLRAQQAREEEERKLREWQQRQSHSVVAQAPGGAVPRGMLCRRSALSLQLASVAPAGAAPAEKSPMAAAPGAAGADAMELPRPNARGSPTACAACAPRSLLSSSRWGAKDDSGSEPSSSDAESSSSSDDEELVTAPLTPCHDYEASSQPAAKPLSSSVAANSTAARGGNGSGGLEDVDLAHLLSMPACVVLEPYGVLLQHAGPPAGQPGTTGTNGRYHTLYSHRRAGGAVAAVAGPAGSVPPSATPATGLASAREVVRCAVLPPLTTLQRRSHGFVAKVATGVAPSLEELLLEVVEEPVSELDLEAPPGPGS